MRRFALLLPALLVLACSDDTTGPVETPDPFWSGTAPAVRLTLVRDAQGRSDRTALVRVEALWDSAWTPGATERRLLVGAEDSSMRYFTGGSMYRSGAGDTTLTPTAKSGEATISLELVKTVSVEVPVYCPNKYDSTQFGALLVYRMTPVKVKQPAVWIHCKD